jgi:hypothetical protein
LARPGGLANEPRDILVKLDAVGSTLAFNSIGDFYAPKANGAMRLVGVAFIVLASVWEANNGPSSVPALDGNLLNYVAAPNRYGLPAFHEIHVWAWEHNPKGTYADWNTHVTCARQSLSAG